jgi:hypothetical protein
LHTLVAGDGLAGWCFVNSPIEGQMSVTAVHVPDEWAARGARRALMAEVARSAFAAGVTHIDIPRGR